MDTPCIVTDRLTLVAATAALARAELGDRQRFWRLLGAKEDPEWPPPLNDEESMCWAAELLEADPDAAGWALWYFLVDDADDVFTAIGNGGFKGRPDEHGTVEVGYSVLAAHQRQGYATEAVKALVAWAFSHSQVESVIAHTLPDLVPSIRVLEKCGFSIVGEGTDKEEGAIMYRLSRTSPAGRRANASRA